MNKSFEAEFTSIIHGIAVGDALGLSAQFKSRAERKKRPVVNMGVYQDESSKTRLFGIEDRGLWSDDTSLTLCLAESLLDGFDLRDQAEKFVAWLDHGYMSARDRAFDVGLQTTEILAKVRSILQSGRYDELEDLASSSDQPETRGLSRTERYRPKPKLRSQYRMVRFYILQPHPTGAGLTYQAMAGSYLSGYIRLDGSGVRSMIMEKYRRLLKHIDWLQALEDKPSMLSDRAMSK